MPSRNIPAYLLMLLMTACCSAQFSSYLRVASLVLAEKSAINSNVSCGRYWENVQPASISIDIFGMYTRKCYNVAETFSFSSYDNDTLEYGSDGTVRSCSPRSDLNCTTQIQANGLNHYSPAANYSQVQVDILYGQYIANQLNQFELRVFAGEACEENSAASEPWFSWGGCFEDVSESTCRELPYSMRSFRLDRNNGSRGECMVAAERGTGAQLSKANFAAVAAGVVLAGLVAIV